MILGNSEWNPQTHPFIARWHHPTGDRLTRFTDTIEVFATETEAIEAVTKPFPANTSGAHVVRWESHGCGPMIATRKRGKKVEFKSAGATRKR